MKRASALVCVVTAFSCAASGCATRGSRAAGTVAAVGGTAAAIAGGAMFISLQSPGNDSDNNGVDDFPENDIACALGGCLLAASLMVAGLVTAGVGLVALSRDDAAPPTPPLPAAAASGPPGETAEVDIRLVAPLPEMPCDAMTLQFAKQARAAARRGACDIARMITRRIADRDQRYADALSISPALARCR